MGFLGQKFMIEYQKLASYYDLLYSDIEYKNDATKVITLYKQYNTSQGEKLLDVACGTGSHLAYLQSSFECTGIDLNELMIKQAGKKCTECKFHVADMRTFQVDSKFDVITCMFHSMNHLPTIADLKKTLINFFDHLESGGIVIMEIIHGREYFLNNSTHSRISKKDNLKIKRTANLMLEGNILIFDGHYEIFNHDTKIKDIDHKHKLRIFEKEEVLSALEAVGFQAIYIAKTFSGKENLSGIFVGIK